MNSTMLVSALTLRARGWYLIPLWWPASNSACACGDLSCENIAKHPMGRLVPHGLKDATNLETVIRSWWKQAPSANIGVVTGRSSGIVVLDLDSRATGDESLAALEAVHGALPQTLESRTGGGGRHLVFAHPGTPITNKAAIAKGLDLRGDGGYFVAPPSVHASGRQYEWVDPECPIALFPEWVGNEPQKGARPYHEPLKTAAVLEGVPEGQRDVMLFRTACKLRGADVPFDMAQRLISEAAANCEPPFSQDLARRKVEEAYKRYLPRPESSPKQGPSGTGGAPSPVLVRLADVVPKRVRWLWPGRIPLGKVTVLDGDPDLAKSLLTLDLAARVTRNSAMPDGSFSDLGEPRGVVLLSAEDDAEDTIRPRLDAAGADVKHIVILVGVKDSRGERGPTVADLDALEEAIRSTTAALVVVDPLMAHLPDERDSHRDQDVRRALAPLAALASRTGAAVIVIRHLNKGSGGNPLYRGGGSIGIIGAARSALLVAPDPDAPDGDRRILVVTKRNLAAATPALAYRVEAPEGVPRIVWEGPTEHTAGALLAVQLPEEERSAQDDAVAFLTDVLGGGDLPAVRVKAAARQAGIAERTLERARSRAGVVTRRQGFGREAVYVWSLHARQKSHVRQSRGVGVHGEHGVHEGAGQAPGSLNGELRPGQDLPDVEGARVWLRAMRPELAAWVAAASPDEITAAVERVRCEGEALP